MTKKLFVSDWDDDQDANGDAVWIEIGGEGYLEPYMKKAGDTMYGNLFFSLNPGKGLWSTIKSSKPSDYTGDDDFGMKIDISDVNTYRHKLKVIGRDGEIVSINHGSSGGHVSVFGRLEVSDGIKVPVEPSKGTDVCNKSYVDSRFANATAKVPAPGSRFTCVEYQSKRVYEPGQITCTFQYMHIQFHSTDADGREILFPAGTYTNDITSTNYVKVWDEDFNLVIYYKASKFAGANNTYKYNKFSRETDYVRNDLIVGKTYYIQDSLLLP